MTVQTVDDDRDDFAERFLEKMTVPPVDDGREDLNERYYKKKWKASFAKVDDRLTEFLQILQQNNLKFPVRIEKTEASRRYHLFDSWGQITLMVKLEEYEAEVELSAQVHTDPALNWKTQTVTIKGHKIPFDRNNSFRLVRAKDNWNEGLARLSALRNWWMEKYGQQQSPVEQEQDGPTMPESQEDKPTPVKASPEPLAPDAQGKQYQLPRHAPTPTGRNGNYSRENWMEIFAPIQQAGTVNPNYEEIGRMMVRSARYVKKQWNKYLNNEL